MDDLRGHFENKPLGQLFEEARVELMGCARGVEAGSGAITESIAWLGLPWRWTVVYRVEAPGQPQLGLQSAHAWAYLVPDPLKVQVCIPMSLPLIQLLPARRLKKFIRDGIIHARSVAGVHWPCYDITLRPQLDDVIDLAQRKYRALVAPPEPVPA